MLAAVVTHSGKRYEMRIEGLRIAGNGEIQAAPEALVQVNGAGREQRLLPPGGAILAEGWDGVRQCIRFIARNYCKRVAESAVEWWPGQDFAPRLRRRLFGMAGGLVRSAQMRPEERRARAMAAAKARHGRPIPPVRREVSPGVLIELWAVQESRGRWVVREARNGVLGTEAVCRSRRQAQEWIVWLDRLAQYLERHGEERLTGEGAPIG